MHFTVSRISGRLLLIAILVSTARGQGLERSVESELNLGRSAARSFEQTVVISADPALLSLVDRVAQQLSRNSRSPIPIIARVIESPEVNVIILAGGHVYITSGLVRIAGTESELAWAIAHGIANVFNDGFKAGLSPKTFLQDRNEAFTNNSTQVFSGGILGAAIMSISNLNRRSLEEADSLGLEYLDKAGYDPTAAISLFQKVEAISDARPKAKDESGRFFIHPPLSQRIKRMVSAVRKLRPRDRYIVTSQ